MVILFFAGIALTLLVKHLIGKRCASEPQAALCQERDPKPRQ